MKTLLAGAKFLLGALLCGGLAACMLGPRYSRPPATTPPAYKEADWKVAEPRDAVPRGKWWEIFGDPQLNALIDQIEISNQNVRVAEAQFRQAYALAEQARAGLFPSVTGTVSDTRSRSPSVGSQAVTTTAPVDTYNLSINPTWELDLWGRLRNSLAASRASAQASLGDLESARLSAQSELALDYFQLRILDSQRQLLDETVAAYQKSLELTRNRYAVGVAGRVDVAQAEAQLKSTLAQAVDVGVQRAQLEHAIAVLIGKPPAEFALPPVRFNAAVPAIPPGLPSELLERRPDIAAAERRVASANAQIGVAKAAYFPSLTLNAAGGFRSSGFANWLTIPSRFWSVGPVLAQTLFDAGLRRWITKQSIAAYDANVASYRQTVLTGFKEVEDNLAALRILEEEAAIQQDAVAAARESVNLTINQYKAGTVSYINVTTVQATLLTNERTAAGLLGQRLAAAVALVKALGGGWSGNLVLSEPSQ